jgi:hypothetical protein
VQDPTAPLEVYKAIIDELVDETRRSGSSESVSDQGLFSNAPSHSEFNDFIGSLSRQQRDVLSRMLQEERDGTIHDVLAMLAWWIDCKGVGFTFEGEPMPLDLSGMGLHGDYVGRRDGWDWPSGGSGSPSMPD